MECNKKCPMMIGKMKLKMRCLHWVSATGVDVLMG